MSLQDDFEKLLELWKSRSLIGKCLLCIAFGSSVLSVGSIADNVYAFKGFLINALHFYRSITEPAREIINSIINITISAEYFDYIIFLSLFVIMYFRASKLVGVEISDVEAEDSPAVHIAYLVAGGLALSLFGYFVIPALIQFFTKFLEPAVVLALFTPILPVFLAVFMNRPRRLNLDDRLTVYFIVGTYFVVAVLAAISEGMFRTNQ